MTFIENVIAGLLFLIVSIVCPILFIASLIYWPIWGMVYFGAVVILMLERVGRDL